MIPFRGGLLGAMPGMMMGRHFVGSRIMSGRFVHRAFMHRSFMSRRPVPGREGIVVRTCVQPENVPRSEEQEDDCQNRGRNPGRARSHHFSGTGDYYTPTGSWFAGSTPEPCGDYPSLQIGWQLDRVHSRNQGMDDQQRHEIGGAAEEEDDLVVAASRVE